MAKRKCPAVHLADVTRTASDLRCGGGRWCWAAANYLVSCCQEPRLAPRPAPAPALASPPSAPDPGPAPVSSLFPAMRWVNKTFMMRCI